eukprot:10046479-Alexandrium_andersonii.AAC.1
MWHAWGMPDAVAFGRWQLVCLSVSRAGFACCCCVSPCAFVAGLARPFLVVRPGLAFGYSPPCPGLP